MPRKKNQQQERDKVIAAMTPLVLLPAFENFMAQVREMKDGAVQYMVHHTSVANERESLVAKGEVRAYLWLLETHQAQKELLEAQAAEQRASQV